MIEEFTAIYVGNGNIEAFKETTQGELLRVYIPKELQLDYQQNKEKLRVRTVRYQRGPN